MQSDTKQAAILQAFRLLLRPLTRILLRSGITWKQFGDVCKATLVDVAMEEFGLHGRPTNISRVAIMTGLGRREVSRLRKLLDEEQPADLSRMNSATRLLTGWHLDAGYLDESGQPLDIPFTGDGISFTSLVRKYSGDIAPITLMRELARTGAIEELDDGFLKVLQRYYMPLVIDAEAVLRAGSVLQDLGNTIDYNLVRRLEEPTLFEGRATNAAIRAVDVEKYRAFIEEEGQALLERVDEWLALHEHSPDTRRQYKTIRLGIGVYQIQDDYGRRSE